MIRGKLSEPQLRALGILYTNPHPWWGGDIRVQTLWSLADYGLVTSRDSKDELMAVLTPFGKQVMDWAAGQ